MKYVLAFSGSFWLFIALFAYGNFQLLGVVMTVTILAIGWWRDAEVKKNADFIEWERELQ